MLHALPGGVSLGHVLHLQYFPNDLMQAQYSVKDGNCDFRSQCCGQKLGVDFDATYIIPLAYNPACYTPPPGQHVRKLNSAGVTTCSMTSLWQCTLHGSVPGIVHEWFSSWSSTMQQQVQCCRHKCFRAYKHGTQKAKQLTPALCVAWCL